MTVVAEPLPTDAPESAWTVYSLAELFDMADRTPEWLVQGMLVHGPNLIIGKRNMGKSRFADHVADCALRSAPIAGRLPFVNVPARVVIITAESGGLSERGRYLKAAGLSRDVANFRALSYPHGVGPEWWSWAAKATGADDRTLLIVDNITRLVTGGLNDDGAVKPILNGIDKFHGLGVASLVLAHIKDRGEDGEGARALGHSAIGQSFRQQITVTRGLQKGSVKLTSDGHSALAAQEFVLNVGPRHGVDFRLDSTSLVRERTQERRDLLREAAAYYVENDLGTLPTIAARVTALEARFGPHDWRNKIGNGRRGMPFQELLKAAHSSAQVI